MLYSKSLQHVLGFYSLFLIILYSGKCLWCGHHDGVIVRVHLVYLMNVQGVAKKTYHDKNSDFLKTVL